MTRPEDERLEHTLELPIQEHRSIGTAAVIPPPTTVLRPEPPPRVAPRRRSFLWFAGLAAAALIILTVGVIAGFALRTGTPQAQPPPPPVPPPTAPATKAPADTPRLAADRFLDAAVTGDQEGVQEQLCELLRGGGGNDAQPGDQMWWLSTLVSYELGEEQVTGRTATVDVDLKVPFVDSLKFELHLLREDEAWRVCGIGPDTA